MKSKNATLVIIIGIIIYISTQNTQSVTINFLFWETSLPLIILIYITLIAGLLFGVSHSRVYSIVTKRNKKKELKEDIDSGKKTKKRVLSK